MRAKLSLSRATWTKSSKTAGIFCVHDVFVKSTLNRSWNPYPSITLSLGRATRAKFWEAHSYTKAAALSVTRQPATISIVPKWIVIPCGLWTYVSDTITRYRDDTGRQPARLAAASDERAIIARAGLLNVICLFEERSLARKRPRTCCSCSCSRNRHAISITGSRGRGERGRKGRLADVILLLIVLGFDWETRPIKIDGCRYPLLRESFRF